MIEEVTNIHLVYYVHIPVSHEVPNMQSFYKIDFKPQLSIPNALSPNPLAPCPCPL